MTIRELKEEIASIPTEYDDYNVEYYDDKVDGFVSPDVILNTPHPTHKDAYGREWYEITLY